MIKTVIEKIWPLPPFEKRRRLPFLFLPKHIRQGIRLERDGDYLCYWAGSLTQIIGFCILVGLLIDTTGRFEWLIDPESLTIQKVNFVVIWIQISGKIALLLFVATYLRIRLKIDLKNDQIPFLSAKDLLRGRQRREWIEFTGALLLVCMLAITISPAYAGGLIGMYGLENNILAVIAEQAAAMICLPLFVLLGISLALTFEKAIRFFPQVQEDMENW